LGSVAIGGTIAAKDIVTIGINVTCTAGETSAGCYSYTVLAADTLATVTTALAKMINKAPDPNVTAGPDTTTDTVVLTARVSGEDGANITIMAIVSANAQITATPSGANLSIYLQSPTSIAPGTLIQISGQNLCNNTGAAVLTQTYLPFSLLGCEIFVDGSRAPLLYVSPAQINAQMPWEYTDRTSVSLYSRVTNQDGSVTVSAPIGVTIVPQNSGIFAQSGSDPRPGIVYHGSSSANDALSIDGLATTGDVVTITIGTAPNATSTNSYAYTVLATDTLASIRDAIVSLINNTPDPNVIASAANEFQRIVLTARIPGPGGEGISVGQSVSANATEIITVFNSATCCDNVQGALITTGNPAAPGEIIYVFSTGIGPTVPSDQPTGKIYTGGEFNPPAIPVDSILAGGVSANILSATLVPGLVGVYSVIFQLSNAQPTDPLTQLTIAQQATVSNVVTFPVGTGSGAIASAVPASPAYRPAKPRRRDSMGSSTQGNSKQE